jgi:hypothetical protein
MASLRLALKESEKLAHKAAAKNTSPETIIPTAIEKPNQVTKEQWIQCDKCAAWRIGE